MAKLGYTWYAKDWGNSKRVFRLTLAERGFYRELIDLAMFNNNKVIYEPDLWARLFNSTIEEIEGIIEKLIEAKDAKGISLVVKKGSYLSIPECEKRLESANKNRINGAKGGRPKTQTITQKEPKQKPNSNPNETQTITQIVTQDERQREREREREKKKSKPKKEEPTLQDFLAYCQAQIPQEYAALKFALEAKYQAWLDNHWKDGNGQPIKNWKTKIQNTIPYLKPFEPKAQSNPQRPPILV